MKNKTLPKQSKDCSTQKSQEFEFVGCARLHSRICQANVHPYNENHHNGTNGVFAVHNAH